VRWSQNVYISLAGIFSFFHNLAILSSEIIIFMINWTPAAWSSDFVITRMITDRTGLHTVPLSLLIAAITKFSNLIGHQQP